MRIYSMGDGIMDETKADLWDKPCIVLVAESREELSLALKDIGFRDSVTIVRSELPSGEESERK